MKFSYRLLCALVLLCVSFTLKAEVIKKIEIQGTDRIDSGYIKSLLLSKEGSNFLEETIYKDIKVLYDTGHFRDITFNYINGNLQFTLKENPVINTITISGNKKINNETILAEMISAERESFSEAKINTDIQRIIDIHYKSGYLAAKASYTLEEIEFNRVNLTINVDQGSKTSIASIIINGNNNYPTSELKSLILTKERKWWRFLGQDVYEQAKVDYDGELLRRFYFSNGFPDFYLINTSTEFSLRDNGFIIQYSLSEGDRYRFGDLTLSSDIYYLEDHIEDLNTVLNEADIEPTDYFNEAVVNNLQSDIRSKLKDLSFNFIAVNVNYRYNKVLKRIDIQFSLQEQRKTFINRIDVLGNTKTREYVIRRELPFKEGDAKIMQDTDDATRNLYRTGYFANVVVESKPTENSDIENIEVTVEEAPTASISGGGGFSTSDGFSINASIQEKNFLGMGIGASISLGLGATSSNYQIGLSDPFFLGRERLFASGSIFRRETGKSAIEDLIGESASSQSDYTNREQGGSFSVGYYIDRDISHNIGITAFSRRVNILKSGVSKRIQELEGDSIVFLLSNTFFVDKRNNALYPTRGSTLRYVNTLAGVGDIGDTKYVKNDVTYTHYQQFLKEDLVFSGILQLGSVVGYGGQDVKIIDKYKLGGLSLRGFRLDPSSGGVGPLDMMTKENLGGSYLFRGSLQIDHPIPGVSNYGLVARAFSDFGLLTDFASSSDTTIMDNKEFKASVGVGIAWRSPAGLISIDIAQPILRDEYDIIESIHINFGVSR